MQIPTDDWTRGNAIVIFDVGRVRDVVSERGPLLPNVGSVKLTRRRDLAVCAEVSPLCGIRTRRLSGKEDMATEPEGPDTVKDAELIVSVLGGDIDRVHRLVLAALGLAAVFVTQIPLSQLRALPEAFRVLTVIAIGLLASAAVLLFHYTQKLNLTRLRLAQAALLHQPPNMHDRWDANFDDPGKLWDRVRAALKSGEPREACEQAQARKQTRDWVRPLTYGNLLLGAGGLLLGVVVARLLLG